MKINVKYQHDEGEFDTIRAMVKLLNSNFVIINYTYYLILR